MHSREKLTIRKVCQLVKNAQLNLDVLKNRPLYFKGERPSGQVPDLETT